MATVGNQLRVIYQLLTAEPSAVDNDIVLSHKLRTQNTIRNEVLLFVLLWAPAQRKRTSMLYFANVFYLFIFFMAALFSGPGERRFAKVLHVVDLECH